jgi:hypothetical protein
VSDDEWHTTSRKLPPRGPKERPCESLPYRGLNRDNHQRVVDDRPSVRVEADVEASYRELTGRCVGSIWRSWSWPQELAVLAAADGLQVVCRYERDWFSSGCTWVAELVSDVEPSQGQTT